MPGMRVNGEQALDIGRFEEEWQSLTKRYRHGSFSFDPSSSARIIIAAEFRRVRSPTYGVYVIRQGTTREVLYVGKGGTIDKAGNFKAQDIPGRLANVKGGDLSADEWFGSLAKEKGPLIIEYVLLASKPESPAFVEACLLQAYINEQGSLPYRNNAF
jgi:hypothetical protein